MSSLSYCLGKIKGRISPHDIKQIKAYAVSYKKEGFNASDANTGAVKDYIKDLTGEYDDIVGQLKSQGVDFTRGKAQPKIEQTSSADTTQKNDSDASAETTGTINKTTTLNKMQKKRKILESMLDCLSG